jgi:hypothetical protein
MRSPSSANSTAGSRTRSALPCVAALIRQGWISLFFWIAFGLQIEAFIGFRIPALLDDPVRRELFRLAHAHGTLLSVVLIVGAVCGRLDLILRLDRISSFGLGSAGLLLPLGFLLGGLWHSKGEPGFGIVLVPIGALLLLATALRFAWSTPSR